MNLGVKVIPRDRRPVSSSGKWDIWNRIKEDIEVTFESGLDGDDSNVSGYLLMCTYHGRGMQDKLSDNLTSTLWYSHISYEILYKCIDLIVIVTLVGYSLLTYAYYHIVIQIYVYIIIHILILKVGNILFRITFWCFIIVIKYIFYISCSLLSILCILVRGILTQLIVYITAIYITKLHCNGNHIQ